ncbi:hypothetical protein U1Q18_016793 [Sarracenia purpurea var. burkii]
MVMVSKGVVWLEVCRVFGWFCLVWPGVYRVLFGRGCAGCAGCCLLGAVVQGVCRVLVGLSCLAGGVLGVVWLGVCRVRRVMLVGCCCAGGVEGVGFCFGFVWLVLVFGWLPLSALSFVFLLLSLLEPAVLVPGRGPLLLFCFLGLAWFCGLFFAAGCLDGFGVAGCWFVLLSVSLGLAVSVPGRGLSVRPSVLAAAFQRLSNCAVMGIARLSSCVAMVFLVVLSSCMVMGLASPAPSVLICGPLYSRWCSVAQLPKDFQWAVLDIARPSSQAVLSWPF